MSNATSNLAIVSEKTKISNEAESSEEYQSHLALAGTKLATAGSFLSYLSNI